MVAYKARNEVTATCMTLPPEAGPHLTELKPPISPISSWSGCQSVATLEVKTIVVLPHRLRAAAHDFHNFWNGLSLPGYPLNSQMSLRLWYR